MKMHVCKKRPKKYHCLHVMTACDDSNCILFLFFVHPKQRNFTTKLTFNVLAVVRMHITSHHQQTNTHTFNCHISLSVVRFCYISRLEIEVFHSPEVAFVDTSLLLVIVIWFVICQRHHRNSSIHRVN